MKPFLPILLVLCSIAYLPGQEFTIKGKITSRETGKPLDGVNVRIKGVPDSTFTRKDGTYEIRLERNFYNPGPDPTLLFYHDGFETLEVRVKGENALDIALSEEAAQLEQVVVTGTAAGQPRKMLTYAVGRIDEDLLSAPSLYAGLGWQGKVAGLRVNQVGGAPGQGPFFQIRSANAIANGQQPLLIVDGIFLTVATLADLNPEDIERVEVLKGPAGASLFGSQAANGVIQIFTKRGANLGIGETRVTYRGEIGFSQEVNRYDLNTRTHRAILDASGPQPILGDPNATGAFSTDLPNLQDYQEDYLFKRGALQSHSLSVAGKTSKTGFRASFQRLADEGVVQFNEGYRRNNFRLNLDHQVSNKIDLQAGAMYAFSEEEPLAVFPGGAGSYLAGLLQMTPMFDLEAGNEENSTPFDWDIDNTGQNITNPRYNEANVEQSVDRSRLLGHLAVDYQPARWFNLRYTAGLDRSNNRYEQFVQKGYLSTDVPGQFGELATATAQNDGGGIQRTDQLMNSFISRVDATLQKRFLGFKTALRASYLYEDLNRRFNGARGENLTVEDIRSLDNAQDNLVISSETQEMIANSFFLVGDVAYKEKFSFSGLVRREGSSLFGPEERWSNYFRVSGAYRITEDIKIPRFRELKLRASVGTAGTRPTFEQRFETFTLVNGNLTKNTLGNNFLRPARSFETEIGIDATFLRAFNLSFTYATIETEDQILLTPLSGASGFNGQWRNGGTVSGTVYEGTLGVDFAKLFRVKNKKFQWNLDITFDRIEQEVTALDVAPYSTGPGLDHTAIFRIEEGMPLGVMVGQVFATSPEQLAGQEGVSPVDFVMNEAGYLVLADQAGSADEKPYRLRDAAGNPLVQPIGDINPDFRMGLANVLRYGGLELYTLFDWKKGGDVYNLTRQYLYAGLRHAEVSQYADVPAGFFGEDGLANGLAANNHFVEDGTFFMLREAALSFTLRRNQLKPVFRNLFETIRLSLIGRNLFTITDYTGFHPDVAAAPQGENFLSNRYAGFAGSNRYTPGGDPSLFAVDVFNYPLRRTLTFSLQASF